MQHLGYALPRIPLPRTPVNKGKKRKATDSRTRPWPGKTEVRWVSIAVVSAVDPLLRPLASLVDGLRSGVRYGIVRPSSKRWLNTIAYRYRETVRKGCDG
jgi:hypothetical protein